MSEDEGYPPRSEWGSGPWENEPDADQFEYLGYPCLALRHPTLGHWCGYVGVPEGHPLYALDYNAAGGIVEYHFDVHGGVTYSGPRGEMTHWFFGFDCGHALDYAPGLGAIGRSLGFRHPEKWEIYRDLEYVRGQCRQLAEQLAAIDIRADVERAAEEPGKP